MCFGRDSIARLKQMARKGLIEVLPKILLTWKRLALFVSSTRQITFLEVQPYVSIFSLGSCFRWILRFSMLKASMHSHRLLWLYVLLIDNPLVFHPEVNFNLLTSSNFLSLHWGISIRKLHSSRFMNIDH